MKVLAEEAWSWMLFEHEGNLLFSVLCGSVGLFDINIALSAQERELFSIEGEAFLKRLAHQVRHDPASFQARQVPGFNDLPGLKEATKRWRAQRAAAP